MRVLEPGHVYQLDWLDGEAADGRDQLIFVNREETPHPGTQTQEVLRALIDRTRHCDRCLRWEGNDRIIYHLRMALVLHEARALERKIEKGEFQPELALVDWSGHFLLSYPPTLMESPMDARSIANRAIDDGIVNHIELEAWMRVKGIQPRLVQGMTESRSKYIFEDGSMLTLPVVPGSL